MNQKLTHSPARSSLAAVVLLLTAASLAAPPEAQAVVRSSAGGAAAAHGSCAISPETVERWAAAGADLPSCVRRAQAEFRVVARRHCAVSADAAERRGARHPGHTCEV
jgi:hypothetical protein